MLLRTLWLSLDPYMRGRMSDAPSYAKPVGIGDTMEGGTISEVVASNVPRFAGGEIVVGRTGWQTHALSDGSGLQKVDPTRAPIQTALGVLGMPGMTLTWGYSRSANPPRARPWWSQQLLVRSARLSARSPASRVPTPSASRRAREMPLRDRATRLQCLHRPSDI
jgi:NADPH-dependent curcumin reductase CurA